MAKNNENQIDMNSYFGTYKIEKQQKKDKVLLFTFLWGCVFVLFVIVFYRENQNTNDDGIVGYTIFLGLFILSTLFYCYSLLNLFFKEITIDVTGIRYKTLIRNIYITKNNYKYHKLDNTKSNKLIILVSKDNKRIVIDLNEFSNKKIESYIRSHSRFNSLNDNQEIENENIEEIDSIILDIAQEEQKTVIDIKQDLTKELSITTKINYIFFIYSIYILLLAEPFEYLIQLSFIAVIALIIYMIVKNGIIIITLFNEEKMPNLNMALQFMIGLLWAKISFNYDFLDYTYIYLFSSLLPLIFTSLVFKIQFLKKYLGKTVLEIKLILIFIYLTLFVSSILSFYNCYYDNSISRTYKVEVLDKYEGHRSGLYLVLEKKIEGSYLKSERVGLDIYENTEIGDSVNVVINDGLLGFKWYYVEKE